MPTMSREVDQRKAHSNPLPHPSLGTVVTPERLPRLDANRP
jgi:hypothetical protein